MDETQCLRKHAARDTVPQDGYMTERLRMQSALLRCETDGGDVRVTLKRDVAIDVTVALMQWVRDCEHSIRAAGGSTLDRNLHAARMRIVVRDLSAALAST